MSRIPKPVAYKRMRPPSLGEDMESPRKSRRTEGPSTQAAHAAPRSIATVVSSTKPRTTIAPNAGNIGFRQPTSGKAPTKYGATMRYEDKGRPPLTEAKGLNEQKAECKPQAGELQLHLQESTEAQMRSLNGENEALKLSQAALKAEISCLHDENKTLKSSQDALKAQIASLSSEKELLNSSYKSSQEQLLAKCSENENLQASIEKYKLDLKHLKDQIIDLEQSLEVERKKNSDITATVVEMRDNLNILQAEKDLSDRKNAKLRSDLEDLQLKFCQLEQKLNDAYEKMQEGETLRRKLHNSVMELKGNVRVFCRMRPLLSSEIGTADANGVPDFVTFPDMERKQVELLKPASGFPSDVMNSTILPKGKQKITFSFDCVFPPNCSQTDVFQEIEPIVQSSLDGYNVCVFAYGQTGSGKTYTMEGPTDDNSCPGMIVLAMHQIFQCSENLHDLGWQHEMYASFLEIYNETINDLLTEKTSKDGAAAHLEIKLAAGQSSSSIRDSQQHEVTVPGLTIVKVNNVDEVCQLINKARKHRAVAATKCNDRSSRSHSVFSMRVKCKHEKKGLAYEGCLNFVDLAGSERLKESGSEGARLEEAKFINKSLSCLGQVFTALFKKEKHIPYRNSRLTYLLQNCLGGNCKTLMFVNISPREEHFGETVNSLRFAMAVNQCHVGVATRNTL
ncbi:hypothetical protein M514_04582 [Trichuris suis]|uniref:Kinesin motor domain-containing protein n=1 Tax=Trichuris suis TaxID=68888 RepID=A0A085NV02_9BILA|nr:hypothetical protein M514_04582 [Trichuris suis]